MGISELPDLYFHVSGKEGKNMTLRLPPEAYIYAVSKDDGSIDRCEVAISPASYPADSGGIGWLLGMPLFIEYTVGYSMTAASLSFTRGCDMCYHDGAVLSRGTATMLGLLPNGPDSAASAGHARPTSIRRVQGRPRYSSIPGVATVAEAAGARTESTLAPASVVSAAFSL